jgi:predicted membrane-bound spermidine synthase
VQAAGGQYVIQRLKVRRRQAGIAFGVVIVAGLGIIAAGLFYPGAADRIEKMGMFLSLFFTGLMTVVTAYWGLGTFEHKGLVQGAFRSYDRSPGTYGRL